MENDPSQNTDREIWRSSDDGNGDYYADSLFLTKDGALGINCGGYAIVKTLREWHRLAGESHPVFIGAGTGFLGPACACCEKQPDPNCDVPSCAFRASHVSQGNQP